MTDQTNTELRILDLEQRLSIAQHNYSVLSANFDELHAKNQELHAKNQELEVKRSETQGFLEMAEAKYAELKLQYDAGFSTFLNTFVKIDEATLSRFVSDKLCAYIDALGTKYPLPEAVDRALERTTEQLVADVIEQTDFSDAAEMALTKAVEEQLDYIHISFRR